METDRLSAAALAATYFHRVTAFRPLPEGGEEAVCENQPCALSRSAQVSAPQPPDRAYVLPEAAYRLTLYTAPDLSFRLGDRVEVRDGGRRVLRGRASDSFRYPSHCVTVLEAVEAGQDSHEAEGEDST